MLKRRLHRLSFRPDCSFFASCDSSSTTTLSCNSVCRGLQNFFVDCVLPLALTATRYRDLWTASFRLIDGLEHFNFPFFHQTGRGNRGELQKHLLRPLVANLVVAREKSLVSLPGLNEATFTFDMNGMECEPFLIAWLVERAETCMKKAEENASQTENVTRGHAFFSAAQKVAGVMPAVSFLRPTTIPPRTAA